MKIFKVNQEEGFTLIEILVVIGIIAILALIVLVAINPARQFALSRNTQRTSNVETILNAIGQNMVDNKGVFTCGTASIPQLTAAQITNPLSTTTPIGARICAGTTSCTGTTVDLSCLTPTYVPALPYDPSTVGASWTTTSNYDTDYYVFQDSNGRTTVYAPTWESSVKNLPISITR